MKCSLPFLAAVAMVCIIAPCLGSERGWQYKVRGRQQTTPKFDDREFSFDPPTIAISYRTRSNSGALLTFGGKLETPSLMSRLCRSTSTLNRYGFDHWKEKDALFSKIEVRSGSMRLIWQRNPAFVLHEDEMILCGPLRNPEDATELYYSSPESPQPQYFSFVLGRSSVPPQLVMTGTNTRYGEDAIKESNLRRDGLQLTLTYASDVWNIEEMDAIFDSFACEPNDCLAGILRKEDINITADEPHILRINLSPAEMVHFNVHLHSTIKFDPSLTVSYKGVLPENKAANFAFNVQKLDSAPLIRIAQANDPPTSSYILPHLTEAEPLVMHEKCIRGKDPSCSKAHRTINVQMYSKNDFSAAATNFEAAFTKTMKPVNTSTFNVTFSRIIEGWVEQPVVDETKPKVALISLAPRWSFDIWQEELLQYEIPSLLILDLEPPINGPFFIKFVPSPGVLTWTANEPVVESMFWEGGHVITIELDGETWDEEVVLGTLIESSVATAVGGAAETNLDGWNKHKHSAVTVSFPLPNTTQLTFVRNLQFDIDEPESVVLTITKDMTRSKRMPEGVAPTLQFTIGKSPGRGIMNPPPNSYDIHERDVWRGDITFNVSLTGEKWVEGGEEFKACKDALMKDLYSNQSTQQGFAVESNRVQFLSNPNVFDRLDARNVRFTASAVPPSEYDVETGEVIFLQSGVIPLVCLQNKNPEELPKTDLAMRIVPQNAVIGVHWIKNGRHLGREMKKGQHPTRNDNGNSSTHNQPETGGQADGTETTIVGISETYLRAGSGLTLVITADFDYFDHRTSTLSPQQIFNGLQSNGIESTGWQYKKKLLTSPNLIDVTSNRSEIRVTFPDLHAPFDISVDELVTLVLKPEWFVSKRAPNTNAHFLIYASPGLAELVSWSDGGGGGHNAVTEDDIRRGLVHFTFSLLGDSWRQQRQPFVDSLVPLSSANATESRDRGMTTFKAAVIPGIDFFTFSYKDGVERVTIPFQAVPEFDISVDEQVAIRFSNSSVSSFLMPTVEPLSTVGTDLGGFVFTIRATRGKMIMSGVVSGDVQEKHFRQGLVTVFITLFGETFIEQEDDDAAAHQIYRSLVGDSNDPTGFNALKDTMVSPSMINITTEGTHASIIFTSNAAFNIDEAETIRLDVPPTLFASGLVPYTKQPLNIHVQLSGGELAYELVAPGLDRQHNQQLTEENLRHDGLRLRLKLVGDSWNQFAISRQPYTFFSGFSASAPVLTEPHGFNANFYFWTPNITFIDESTLELYLCGNCSGIYYNIAEDESISFAVTNAIFVKSARTPQPNVATFSVVMIPREIIVVFEEHAGSTWSGGRVTVAAFQGALSDFLSVPSARIKASIQHDDDDDMKKKIRMYFSSPLTAIDGATLHDQSDRRTSTELSDLFLGLNESYTRQRLYIVHKYYADEDSAMPSSSFWNERGGQDKPNQQEDKEKTLLEGPLIWAVGVTLFLGTLALFVYCSTVQQRKAMSSSVRLGSDPSTHKRKVGHVTKNNTRLQYDRGDENHRVMSEVDPGTIYSGQQQQQQGTARGVRQTTSNTATGPVSNPLSNAVATVSAACHSTNSGRAF